MSLSDFNLSVESRAYMEQVQALVAASSTAVNSIEALRSPEAAQQRRDAVMGAHALATEIHWHPMMNLLPTADELPPMFPSAE